MNNNTEEMKENMILLTLAYFSVMRSIELNTQVWRMCRLITCSYKVRSSVTEDSYG